MVGIIEEGRIAWTKPNGLEIVTNDAKGTIAEAERLKWERQGAMKPMKSAPK